MLSFSPTDKGQTLGTLNNEIENPYARTLGGLSIIGLAGRRMLLICEGLLQLRPGLGQPGTGFWRRAQCIVA